jgi:CHAD domain-containing protein
MRGRCSFRIHSCMPDTPGAKPAASSSAGSAIRARTAILTGVLSKIEQGPREPQAQLIHKLRVSTRRLTVTMTVLVSSLTREGKRLKRGAKELRRAAGALRDADVHSQLLNRTLREAKTQESLREVPKSLRRGDSRCPCTHQRRSQAGLNRASPPDIKALIKENPAMEQVIYQAPG